MPDNNPEIQTRRIPRENFFTPNRTYDVSVLPDRLVETVDGEDPAEDQEYCSECGEYPENCECEPDEESPEPFTLPGIDLPDITLVPLQTVANHYRFSDDLPVTPAGRADMINSNGRSLTEAQLYLLDRLTSTLLQKNIILSCRGCSRIKENVNRNPEHTYCKNCYRSSKKCRFCGDRAYTGNRENTDCQECLRKYVLQYNYRSSFKPRLTDKDLAVPPNERLLVGVEFEIEANAQLPLAKEIDDRFTWCYMKHDGSLTNGFEIVTHPFSHNWFKENKDQFENFFARITQQAYVDFHCGTHFHLSMSHFSNSELYKLLKLIHENKTKMYLISKRTDQEWLNRYATFNAETSKHLIQKAMTRQNIVRNPATTSGKYVAVNFSAHNTVEFRFFAGCDSFDTFMQWYEFILACALFVKTAPINRIRWKDFSTWSRSQRYPYLQSLISEIG